MDGDDVFTGSVASAYHSTRSVVALLCPGLCGRPCSDIFLQMF